MNKDKKSMASDLMPRNVPINFRQQFQKSCLDLMENCHQDLGVAWQEFFNISQIYFQWLSELRIEPNQVAQFQSTVFNEYVQLLHNIHNKFLKKESDPVHTAHMLDKRFTASDWENEPFFYCIQRLYVLFSERSMQWVEKNASKNPKVDKQIYFFTRQYLDALSPTNFILTNPEILRQTLVSKGENLTEGFKNFLKDLTKTKDHWHMNITDLSAFEVGKNIAVTPGKIIFQNRMMQLIQYAPTTEKTYERPLLIIPPWINKFYILDLSEKNSFVKWAVDKGLTIFMISWINPDESYRDTGFEDYMNEGIFSALDAVYQATNQQAVNALGLCLGGTLLAATLAMMHAKRDERIKAATFLTTLIDFSEPGEIEVFIDERKVAALEDQMNAQGYLDGRILMTTFSMLRANDLLWSSYINNYLRGQKPVPLDLLYWNCDPSNLPMKMHSFYLRSMYLHNRLAQPEGLTLEGVKLDVRQVEIPAYFLSTERDHIAPWTGTYLGAQLFKGPVNFVLAGSGHIAGVINPPVNKKYHYRYQQAYKGCTMPIFSQEWYDQAQVENGSWWEHWFDWIAPQSGVLINPPIPGHGKLRSLEDAPGTYVKKRLL